MKLRELAILLILASAFLLAIAWRLGWLIGLE